MSKRRLTLITVVSTAALVGGVLYAAAQRGVIPPEITGFSRSQPPLVEFFLPPTPTETPTPTPTPTATPTPTPTPTPTAN